jgi:hypothetical protein
VLVYLVGDILLAYHAFLLNDLVFLTLNGIAAPIAFFNAYLIVRHQIGVGKAGAAKVSKNTKKRK